MLMFDIYRIGYLLSVTCYTEFEKETKPSASFPVSLFFLFGRPRCTLFNSLLASEISFSFVAKVKYYWQKVCGIKYGRKYTDLCRKKSRKSKRILFTFSSSRLEKEHS